MSEKLPNVIFKCRENGEWVDKSTIDLFLLQIFKKPF